MNRIFFLLTTILLHLSVLAQQGGREVSGRVTDNGGQPLAGATVSNRNSGATAVSASNGTYRIRANTGDVLVFTIVSFAPVERKVGEGSVIDVALQSSASQLSDVVVVGYGQSTRRALTSAVTTIRPADMNRGPITDVGQLLQGKVPGLNITANGDPNRRAAIILRGASTINSPGNPFFVIDGVPGADIALVAPDDIASIDVLKDAAATAIYGNRAAGGVIMITTKKGRKGQSQVSYNGYVGFEKVSSRLNLMDATQHREYLKSQGLSYNPLDDLNQNTDWQSAVLKPQAISHNHNLSFSGGSDHASYSASINYINREGIMIRSNQERFIARLNVEQMALNDKLKFSLNVTNSRTNAKLVPLQNIVLDQMTSHLPVSPIYNADGSWFENFNISGYFNPVGLVDNARDDQVANNLVASLGTEVKLPLGLTYNVLLSHQTNNATGSQFYNSYYSKYNPAQFYSNPDPGFSGASLIATSIVGVNGSAFRSSYTDKTNNLETYLGWNRRIGEHSLNAVVGYSWLSILGGDGIQSSSTNFITDFISYNNLSLGNPYAVPSFRIRLAGGAAEKRLISDFARVNYSYKDKYLLQGSIRRDGSSVFGTNYQWGYFPSVGLAWRVTNEGFMQGQKLFDDLKLRVSHGVTGNSEGIGAFNAKLVYGVTGTYYNNGILENSYGPQQGANPDLRWERTSTSNIGLDFSILKGRVSGSVDLYEKLTSDMLFQYAVSPSLVPGGRIWANGGSMSNRGVEFMLNATPVQTKDFTWSTSLNLAHNRNEITSLTNPYSKGDSILYVGPRGQGQTGASLQILKVGKPLGQFFSFIYEGKDANGMSQFRKKDGTIISAPLNGTDYFYIGDAQPRLLAGWNNTLRYHRLDFNFFFRGFFGAKIFNASRANLSYTPNASVNNLHALVTAADKVSDARNSFFSTRYVEKGDYVRLDNATLGYSLDAKIKGVSAIRFYLTGNNLLTLTKYTGIDPEINQGGVAPGVDNNNFYPRTRTIMFGVTVSL
ncbi:MAG: SusC/RagA family TonB-linked outer membrane protein [Chitinophagia bacterium]|nr:SusC/RagA family TonB-linked outer membrane protein [Chitinophagia bacterium]